MPFTTISLVHNLRSLCPTIYGHEMVKAGLVLGLFGGSQKFVDSKVRLKVDVQRIITPCNSNSENVKALPYYN